MSLQSATYYIKKAEEVTNLNEAQVYALLAQAEMLVSIEHAINKLAKVIEGKNEAI